MRYRLVGLVLPARADGPDLAGRQRVAADAVLALQLRRRDELLDPVEAHGIAELGVAELGRADPLLLFLHAAAHLQREPHGPFQILVRDVAFGVRDKAASEAR